MTIRITKRTTGGTFTGGRLIGGFAPSVDRDRVTGDVVATAGTWSGVTVSPASTAFHSVVALAGVGGKATVLIDDGNRVYSRTQT